MKKPIYFLALLIALSSYSCKSTKVPQEDPAMTKKIRQLESQVTQLNGDLASKSAQVGDLENQNRQLNTEMNVMKKALADVTAQMQESSDDYGVWFRVQIGAYEGQKVDQNLQTTDQLGLEGDDLQKIVLGRFRSYDDAKRLQTQLQSVGLKDAWIVSYKDGARVPISEVRN